MTGFARESAETELGVLSWEIRAVNHRYLDVSFRLPEELRPHERTLAQCVGGQLRRGKVDCTLNFQRAAGDEQNLRLDKRLIELMGDRLQEIKDIIPHTTSVNPLEVLRWPGVIVEPEIDAEPVLDAATALLEKALESLQAMRASEGERIAAMLASRCDEIEKIAGSVRSRMPEVLEAAAQKQRERIAKLDVEADPGRLEVELALVAQKLDVAEEVDRLDSHLSEIRQAIASDEPVGRRLDFLMQELNREANTLGSKSGDAETSRAAVDLKVLIEQMREQVQNVE
ncbi:MAG: YicC/YloC family endoribonuclease [Woeseiaceae bacterium]|nr:YicC/YloC family endoribonuclease [Woeseiaceae bacterium]